VTSSSAVFGSVPDRVGGPGAGFDGGTGVGRWACKPDAVNRKNEQAANPRRQNGPTRNFQANVTTETPRLLPIHYAQRQSMVKV
jgi:hypothetical protein